MVDKSELTRIPVYGSLAYDFETAVPIPEREWERPRREERKVVIPAPPAPEAPTRTRTQPRPKPRQAISPFSVIGFACAAVLLVFSLMAKIDLTVITDEAAQLETQLSALQLSQARLKIEHASVFNRTEIEEYATTVLGMQRPREEQIIYLNSSVPDKAVVLGQMEDEKGIFTKLTDMFGTIVEYFA